jgi:Uma2 family endonuclease
MVAVSERTPQHMVLSGITWDTFERILDEMGERHLRATYDNGELEFITPSLEHESYASWIARLIFFVALEFHVPISSGGSTTLKRSLRRKGLEPDECFWIQKEALMRGKKRWKADRDPPPDLAVEIDITSSWLDRLGIYAALQVPELWRFDGETLKVLILGANGKYREKTKSLAFPTLPLDGFARFVAKLGSKDEVSLIQEFVAWLRAEVITKSVRRSGKKDA